MSLSLPPAFFRPDPDHPGRFHPSAATIGPWSPQLQHGGPPLALLAHALRTHPSEGPMALGRLTVEILGPIPLDPCEVEVEVLRPGKKIELLQARYRAGGRVVLTAQAWRLQPVPGVSPVAPDPWCPPAMPDQEHTSFFAGTDGFPYGRSLEWRFAEGSFREMGPATVWARLRIPLIEGRETGGVEGLVTLLDSANGISCELDFQRWSYVPVDLTLNLHRAPVGPWYGMAARTILGDSGIGTVTTTVFDVNGPVGKSLHTLFVRPR